MHRQSPDCRARANEVCADRARSVSGRRTHAVESRTGGCAPSNGFLRRCADRMLLVSVRDGLLVAVLLLERIAILGGYRVFGGCLVPP